MSAKPGRQRKAESVDRQRRGQIMLKRVVCDHANLIAMLEGLERPLRLDPLKADDPAAIDEAVGRLLDSLALADVYMKER